MSLLLTIGSASYKETTPRLSYQESNIYSHELRWVLRVAFDSAETDVVYITSHSDAGLPAGATAYHGLISNFSEYSQTLGVGSAEVGRSTFTVLDKDGRLTALIGTKLDGLDALRNKVIRVYEGIKGDGGAVLSDLWAMYENTATYVLKDIETMPGEYKFIASDPQRDLNVDVFDLVETRLTSSITATATTIPALDVSSFEKLTHGSSFTDAPNQTVGYARIPHPEGDEIFRYTGNSAGFFTGCTRGVLGTTAKAHDVDASKSDEYKTKITEVVYIEAPIPEILYLLITGNYCFKQAASVPSGWHANVSRSQLEREDFLYIGNDIYQPFDQTQGMILRFIGLEKQNLKQFIEQEIYRLGFYSPVHANGKMGLRRRASMLRDAPEAFIIDESVTDSANNDTHKIAQDSVINLVKVHWNYDVLTGKPTRESVLIDSDSVSTYKETRLKEYYFRGLHGSRHTTTTIKNIFAFIKDRYSSAPYVFTKTLNRILKGVEVGQVYRVKDKNVRDPYGPKVVSTSIAFVASTQTIESASVNFLTKGFSDRQPYIWLYGSSNIHNVGLKKITAVAFSGGVYKITVTGDMPLVDESAGSSIEIVSSFDRSCEVINYAHDRLRGSTTLTFLGSTARSSLFSEDTTGYALADAAYTESGTNLTSVLTISGGQVTANGTVNGNYDLHHNLARYYHSGDLTINAGVTVSTNKNVLLFIMGHLTINGDLDASGSAGGGAAAPVVSDFSYVDTEPAGSNELLYRSLIDGNLSVPGAMGTTYAPPGLAVWPGSSGPTINTGAFLDFNGYDKRIVRGTYDGFPPLELEVNSNGRLNISKLPRDLRGTPGPSGKMSHVHYFTSYSPVTASVYSVKAGAGGGEAGGAIIICRGLSFGSAGRILTNGGDGGLGSTRVFTYQGGGTYTIRGGTGAPGTNGGVGIFIDGYESTIPTITQENMRAFVGDTPIGGGDEARTINSSRLIKDYTPGATIAYQDILRSPVNAWESAHRIQYIPHYKGPEEDTNYRDVAAPDFVTAVSDDTTVLIQRDGTVIPRLRVSWGLSASSGIKGYRLEFIYAGDTEYTTVSSLTSPDTSSAFIQVVEGKTVTARVKAISIHASPGGGFYESEYTSSDAVDIYGKTNIPNPVDSFLYTEQADGTRQFSWVHSSPPFDLLGYRLYYAFGLSGVIDSMTLLYDGILSASPHENSQLGAGDYTFALVVVDTSYNESSPRYITASLGNPRGVTTFKSQAEHPTWSGTKTSCFVNFEGYLEAESNYTWNALDTWDDWISWGNHDGATPPVSPIIYEMTTAIDLGVVRRSTLYSVALASGIISIEVNYSSDDISYSGWTAYSGQTLTSRYYKFRITITGTDPLIQNFANSFSGAIKRDRLEDHDISSYTGAYENGVGDININLTDLNTTINGIVSVLPIIQNADSATWSWTIVDKAVSGTVGPNIQFRQSGTLTDPTSSQPVDFLLEYY